MTTAFVPAHAARCGLQATLLAARSYTCSERIFEGPHGFATFFVEEAHLAAATDGLGTQWEVLATTYKPYPCGIAIHPVIDACLQIVQELAPAGGQESQVSLQH